MIGGGILISGGDSPKCSLPQENDAINTFVDQAEKANKRFASDNTAELHIETYFSDAYRKIIKSSADKEAVKVCVQHLMREATVADLYRDGFIENFFSTNIMGIYIPPTVQTEGGLLLTYLSTGWFWNGMMLGIPAALFGLKGNFESARDYFRHF